MTWKSKRSFVNQIFFFGHLGQQKQAATAVNHFHFITFIWTASLFVFPADTEQHHHPFDSGHTHHPHSCQVCLSGSLLREICGCLAFKYITTFPSNLLTSATSRNSKEKSVHLHYHKNLKTCKMWKIFLCIILYIIQSSSQNEQYQKRFCKLLWKLNVRSIKVFNQSGILRVESPAIKVKEQQHEQALLGVKLFPLNLDPSMETHWALSKDVNLRGTLRWWNTPLVCLLGR